MNISDENNDIENSLQLLSSFESKCQELVSDNIRQQEQLTLTTDAQTDYKKQIQDKNEQILFLQESVDMVQSVLGEHLQQQEENFELKNKLKQLENMAEEVKINFEREKESWGVHLEELESRQGNEIEAIREEQLSVVSNLNTKCSYEMTLKDKRISELEGLLNVAEKGKKEEITKLKLEYEARLMKAMRQNSISSLQNQSMSVGVNNPQEIYRRKLEHVQQLHNREVSSLKQKINELQERFNFKQRTRS